MAQTLMGYLTRSRLARVAALLRRGAVAILPTDTLYGFHCASSRLDAVERIRALKGRREGSGLILLTADIAMADRIVARWPGESRGILARIWPAPLTAILPARARVPSVLAPRGTIAVRVPAHAELRSLIAAVGEPLVSTSANVSGRSPIVRIAEIERVFPGLDAYISRRGRSRARASTIVDFTTAKPALVRAGALRWLPRPR